MIFCYLNQQYCYFWGEWLEHTKNSSVADSNSNNNSPTYYRYPFASKVPVIISILVGSYKVDNFCSHHHRHFFRRILYFWQIWDQPQVQVHRSGFHRGGQDSEQVPVDRQDEKLWYRSILFIYLFLFYLSWNLISLITFFEIFTS